MIIYKVVTETMQSLGLKGNTDIVQYELYEWHHHPQPIDGDADEGGYWACRTLGAARELVKYMWKHHGKNTRIFRGFGFGLLYMSNRRVKVRGIRLNEEIQ